MPATTTAPRLAVEAARRTRATVVAITNQKGGVGKTTTTANLGAALALRGQQVLVVDLDASFNLTYGFGVEGLEDAPNIGFVLEDKVDAMKAVIPLPLEGLFLLPSRSDLSVSETWLRSQKGAEYRLEKKLAPLRDHFDVILLDCPPSLSLLMSNALCAADAFLIPCYAEGFSTEGLSQLMDTVREVREYLNRDPAYLGLVVTNLDLRLRLHKQFYERLTQDESLKVFARAVGTNSRIKEAQALGQTVMEYDPKASGALAYGEIADEFLDRLEAL